MESFSREITGIAVWCPLTGGKKCIVLVEKLQG